MRFTVKNTVLAEDLPKDILKDVKKDLTITNPMFSKKMAMGLSIFGVDQYHKYYNLDNDIIEFPVGYLPKLTGELLSRGHKAEDIDIIDNRTTTVDNEFFNNLTFNATLRDYQQDMEDAALNHTLGVVQAKTGSGKTVTFVKIVTERKINTIVLVNTKELAYQTVDAFVEFTNLEEDDIGFIGDGRYEVKPITVGILQSMRNIVEDEKNKEKLDEINAFFGQSIADETHIIAAETYYNVMSNLNFKYKYGFSATPFREDGLTDVIHFANGPLIHKVPDEAVKDHLVIPGYEQIYTDYYFPLMDTSEYQTMITHMGEDKERNDFILEYFKKVGTDLPSVFLCNRTAQVRYLHKNIENSIMLTSNMSTKQREEAMKKLRSGEAIHVVSTFGLFSTGLDIPRLECEYIVSPMKSEIKLRQSAGRLMRKASGKHKAMIYDFVDIKVGLLAGQSKVRKRILTSL